MKGSFSGLIQIFYIFWRCLEGSNEQMHFYGKMWRNIVWGGVGMQKFCETLHVWPSYRNYWIHLGEYLVHAWLGFITKIQKYIFFAYNWSTSEEKLLWMAGIICAKIQTHCKAIYLIVQRGETSIYIRDTELKMDASYIVNE